MTLTLFVRNNCATCLREEVKIREVLRNRNYIHFVVRDLDSEPSNLVFIVPALFVNDELYMYGEINKNKLEKKIEKVLSFEESSAGQS